MKKYLEGIIVYIVGIIIVIATSLLTSSPKESYFLGIIAAIIYLASIIYITRKRDN